MIETDVKIVEPIKRPSELFRELDLSEELENSAGGVTHVGTTLKGMLKKIKKESSSTAPRKMLENLISNLIDELSEDLDMFERISSLYKRICEGEFDPGGKLGKMRKELEELNKKTESLKRGISAVEDDPETTSFPCPGCGCLPMAGLTPGCDHAEGCGFHRQTGEGSGLAKVIPLFKEKP